MLKRPALVAGFFTRNAGWPLNSGGYFRYNAIADAVIDRYISAS